MGVEPRRLGLAELRLSPPEEFARLQKLAGVLLHRYTQMLGDKTFGYSVALIRIPTDAPEFEAIERLMLEDPAARELFGDWGFTPRFSKEEQAGANEFVFLHRRGVDAPWQFGTQYDQSLSCEICGAGQYFMPPVYHGSVRQPKTARMVTCPGGERLFDSIATRDLINAGLKGFLMSPVLIRRTRASSPERLAIAEAARDIVAAVYKRRAAGTLRPRDLVPPRAYTEQLMSLPDLTEPEPRDKYWYAMHVLSYPVDMTEHVQLGGDFFDIAGKYAAVCPWLGDGRQGVHIAGFTMISDIAARTPLMIGTDVAHSLQRLGEYYSPASDSPTMIAMAELHRELGLEMPTERPPREAVRACPIDIISKRMVAVLEPHRPRGPWIQPIRNM